MDVREAMVEIRTAIASPSSVPGPPGDRDGPQSGIVSRLRRFAGEGGFAVAVVDVPGHGDRPKDEEVNRIATDDRARMDAGEPWLR